MKLLLSIAYLIVMILCHNGGYGKRKFVRPNIIFILMDDLDVQLGSMQVMTKTSTIFAKHGVKFTNAFVTSPICCPSRSSILTGMYAHNHGCLSNTVNCASIAWRRGPEKRNFGHYLKESGYKTGYFGKYLNNYNGNWVPKGWDKWTVLLKNSRFYNYTLRKNTGSERHGYDYAKDYFTDVVTNHSINFFLRSKNRHPNRPVMMVLGMAAPHGPEDPAPQHKDLFDNVTAPRHPNFNVHSVDKHWIIRHTKPMDKQKIAFSDHLHRRRLLTLLSADDAIARLYASLKKNGIMENTYIFLSSDHGYHLGQFGMAKGKSQPYETDIRIPFYVLGPGVPKGREIKEIVLNIDLAPTFLDIANARIPGAMDGKSVLKLIESYSRKNNDVKWRETFLVEKSKKLYASSHKKLARTKMAMIREKCRLLNYSTGCTEGEEWRCTMVNNQLRFRKCRRKTRSVRMEQSRKLYNSKRCLCMRKETGVSGRRLSRRALGWRSHLNYRLKKKFSFGDKEKRRLEYQRQFFKELSSRHNVKTKGRIACRCNGKWKYYQRVKMGTSKRRRNKKKRRKSQKWRKHSSCYTPGLNCFLHTNNHWKTEPLWKNGSFCFCPTSSNNSYWCIRTKTTKENYIYCEFVTSFCEFYDLNKDPYQLTNSITTISKEFHMQLHNKLEYMVSCRHASGCNIYPGRKIPRRSIVSLDKACTNTR
ncbi:extracellular sulfatase Sulf-1-like isoform X3 [Xenia sp. Carnegie-2017]|uniref:extracellular sulfatase Sulf-1-like isoform X3 n=1 Tax=Xenia sp. Carnegie-2017 TaxID=2897299 RepID=UPI001F04C5B9|nr:extracellular sulfatase Sulf-1-like isoform X3 [Xenia sp. Carnegie-2017]